MAQRIYDGTVPPLCGFTIQYASKSRSLWQSRGRRHFWYVAVPCEINVAPGDFVKIPKQDGSTVWVQLVSEYPFLTKKARLLRSRWDFVNVVNEQTVKRLEKALLTREAFDAYRVVIKEQYDIIESQNATIEMQAGLIERLKRSRHRA